MTASYHNLIGQGIVDNRTGAKDMRRIPAPTILLPEPGPRLLAKELVPIYLPQIAQLLRLLGLGLGFICKVELEALDVETDALRETQAPVPAV